MAGRAITHSEQWWADAPAHHLRCTAPLKNGKGQCRREAATGTTVCRSHGADIPVVQAAAARRIQMSVDDAVKQLLGMLSDDNVQARDKINILRDLLDRGGLGATSKILLGVAGVNDPLETLFASILADPDATYDPSVVVPELPAPDPAQDAVDRAEQGLDYDDLIAGRLDPGFEDIVDAELVEEDEGSPERITSVPPRHIREAMEQLL